MRILIVLSLIFLVSCGGGAAVPDPGNGNDPPPAGMPTIDGAWHLTSSAAPDGWPVSCEASIARYAPTSSVYLLDLPPAIVAGLELPADQAEKWESGIWIAETHDAALAYPVYRSRLYYSAAGVDYIYYVEVHLRSADNVEFRLQCAATGVTVYVAQNG